MNQKEKQIIDAAQQLFIKNGFRMTSIQDILEAANIAKGTFYNYFNSKNECLMAILDSIQKEIQNERMRIAREGEYRDEKLFIKQMNVRFKMDKKHNIMALFHSVPISDDADLKSFMIKQYELELQWICQRLMDLYRSNIRKQVMDYAITFMGILQYSLHAIEIFQIELKNTEDVIEFSLRNLKAIIDSTDTNEPFFKIEYPSIGEKNSEVIRRQLIQLLQKISPSILRETKLHHYTRFLLDELQEESPRLFLIESVLLSLRNETWGANKDEVEEITQLLYCYLNRSEEE